MKKNKIIILLMVISIICLICILILIYLLNLKNIEDKEAQSFYEKMQENNISDNNNENITYLEDIEEFGEVVGDINPSWQINAMPLKVEKILEAIKRYINEDDMTFAIKEYLYTHGILDATTAEYISYEHISYEYIEEINLVNITFKLNNSNGDIIKASVNLNTKEIYVYK